MPRWMILAGCLALIVAAISAIGPNQVQATDAPTATAIAPVSGVATAQVGPLPAAPPIGVLPPLTPVYPNDGGRHVLRLTPRDSGGVFSIPVGTLIYLFIPRMPRTRLDYNPAILQELFEPPLPMQSGGASPNLTATPALEDSSTLEPHPAGPQLAPIAVPWRLIAIAPRTTSLTLGSLPCPPGSMCPKHAIPAFRFTILV